MHELVPLRDRLARLLVHRGEQAADQCTDRHAQVQPRAERTRVVRGNTLHIARRRGRLPQGLASALLVAVPKVGGEDLLGGMQQLGHRVAHHDGRVPHAGLIERVQERHAERLVELLEDFQAARAVQDPVVVQDLERSVVFHHGRTQFLARLAVLDRVVRHVDRLGGRRVRPVRLLDPLAVARRMVRGDVECLEVGYCLRPPLVAGVYPRAGGRRVPQPLRREPCTVQLVRLEPLRH